jgi:WD40 repeat protein
MDYINKAAMPAEYNKCKVLSQFLWIFFAGFFASTVIVSAASDTAQPLLPNLRLTQELPTPGRISAIIWSSNGAKLAAASMGQAEVIPFIPSMSIPNPYGKVVTIWDSSGRTIRRIQRDTVFFREEDMFAFVAHDRQLATPPPFSNSAAAFVLFDVETGEVAHTIVGSRATVLIASPDQSILAGIFGSEPHHSVALYSTPDWTKLPDLPIGSGNRTGRADAIAFSPDGRLLATGELRGKISIYDVATNRLVREIEPFPDRVWAVPKIAFSPDGGTIALGSSGDRGVQRSPSGGVDFVPPNNSSLRVFRVNDGQLIAAYGGTSAITSGLAWSPDGRFITFISARRILHIWNPTQPGDVEQTVNLSSARQSAGPIALSPDGAMLAVGVGQNVKVYQIAW